MKHRLLNGLLVILTVLFSGFAVAQDITGTVSDGSGPLPGASVVVKGTQNSASTDLNGKYAIKNAGANAVLVFSYIGLASQEVAVAGKSVVNVVLKDDQEKLKEVVVIGYGSVKKKDATGAIDQLSSKKFDNVAASNPAQLLRGKLAGVQVTQSSGEPGASASIKIRGNTSIRSGNDPLIVLDGVPLTSGSASAGGDGLLGGATPRNPLNFINQNDIESISVLKDAAATAIYGSNGANGVIMITTKKSKSKKTEVTYNSSVVSSKIQGDFDLLSPEQFAGAVAAGDVTRYADAFNQSLVDFPGDNDKAIKAGQAAKFDQGGRDYNWKNVLLRNALSFNNDISIASGSETSSTRLSLAANNVEGIVRKSALDKYTANLYNTNDLFGGILRIETKLGYASLNDLAPLITNNPGYEGNLIGSAFYWNPTKPLYNADGSYNVISQDFLNPQQLLDSYTSKTKTSRFIGSMQGILKINSNLKFNSLMAYEDIGSTRSSELLPSIKIQNVAQVTVPGSTTVKYGRGTLESQAQYNRTFENFFTYNNKLGDNFNYTGVLGYSYYDYHSNGNQSFGVGYDPAQTNLIDNIEGALQNEYRINSYRNREERQSYFGRLDLNIYDKLLLSGSLRRDGNSKFGINNKYGNFPSASAAYKIVSGKDGVLNSLKIRASWGVTGNSNFPVNSRQEKQAYGLNGSLNNTNASNDDLKWETTTQTSVGLDFEIIKNRVSGTVDYFMKDTKDLIVALQPAATQPGAPLNKIFNLKNGTLKNSGLEFGLNFKLVDTDNVGWDFGVNSSFLKNKFVDTSIFYPTGAINGQGLTGAYSQVIANDTPVYAFYLYEFRGYDASGASIYADAAGNDTGLGTAAKKILDKTPLPTMNLGFNTSFRYKNFDASTSWYGAYGHYLYNNTTNAYFFKSAFEGGRNVTPNVLTSAQDSSDPNAPSTKYLEKGDFLRMGNITLGYTLRGKAMEAMKINSLRFYVNGDNLLVFTDYSGFDPEVDTDKALNGVPSFGNDFLSYPRAKSIAVGLNVNF